MRRTGIQERNEVRAMTKVICEQCDEGYSYHDCGEDSCACLNPVFNVICETCDGKGYWTIKEDFGEEIYQSDLDQILESRRTSSEKEKVG